MKPRLALRAYAKVNLCLSVGAPVSDGPKAGFHPIASWMQCIDLYDEVTVTPLPAGEKSTCSIHWAQDALCPSPIDWPLEKDLGARAHKALESFHRERGGPDMPVAIQVVKRIPVGAGLGGGSSDAATVLLGLLDLFDMNVQSEQLLTLAASLGSDVVFFTDNQPGSPHVPRAALIGGVGDQVQRVESVGSELVLIIPPYGCPTGPVYAAFDQLLKERQALDAAERAGRAEPGREKQTGPKASLVEARWKRMSTRSKVEGEHLFNDLALAAFLAEPRLGRLVTALSNATREQAHVTGSGSGVFIPSTPERVGRLLERVHRLLAASEDFAGVKALRTRLL